LEHSRSGRDVLNDEGSDSLGLQGDVQVWQVSWVVGLDDVGVVLSNPVCLVISHITVERVTSERSLLDVNVVKCNTMVNIFK
jgi:hypothetical protein